MIKMDFSVIAGDETISEDNLRSLSSAFDLQLKVEQLERQVAHFLPALDQERLDFERIKSGTLPSAYQLQNGDVVTELQEIIKENERLRKENDMLQAEREDLKKQLRFAQQDRNRLMNENQNLMFKVHRTRARLL